MSRRIHPEHVAPWLIPLLAATGCNGVFGIEPPIVVPPDAGSDAAPIDAAEDGDAAPTCTPTRGPCQPFPQCGCDAPDNCNVLDVDGTTACVATGTTPFWNSCGIKTASVGECQKGAECIGSNCKPFCNTVADCPGPNRTCEQITKTGKPYPFGPAVPGLKVCSAGCDPILPSDTCGPGVNCTIYPSDGLAKDHGDCIYAKGQGMGPGTCTVNEDCAVGFMCFNGADCRKLCRVVGHPEDCTQGTCAAFTLKAAIAGIEYGACQ